MLWPAFVDGTPTAGLAVLFTAFLLVAFVLGEVTSLAPVSAPTRRTA